jgi:predicted nuclease of predicted toxin-antitoxin system
LGSDIRLYFDENVQVAVAEQMQARGIDAVTARDLNLLGENDANHLQLAASMGRTICTHDYDFLRLHAEGVQHAGIIIAPQSTTTVGDWVRALELICSLMTADEMENHVEYL